MTIGDDLTLLHVSSFEDPPPSNYLGISLGEWDTSQVKMDSRVPNAYNNNDDNINSTIEDVGRILVEKVAKHVFIKRYFVAALCKLDVRQIALKV